MLIQHAILMILKETASNQTAYDRPRPNTAPRRRADHGDRGGRSDGPNRKGECPPAHPGNPG